MADEKPKDTKQSIDEILAEVEKFDAGTGDPPPAKDAKPPDELAAIKAELAELREKTGTFEETATRIAARELDDDMAAAVRKVKGHNPDLADLPDHALRSWLTAEAVKDKRIEKSWQERKINPTGFDKVLEGMSAEMGTTFKSLREARAKETEERESVNSYVRSQSTSRPIDPDIPSQDKLSAMPDHELEALEKRLAAKAR